MAPRIRRSHEPPPLFPRLQGAAAEAWQPTQLSLEDAYLLGTENNLGGLAAPTEVSATSTQQRAP